jgi:hypothetical protein
MMLFLNEYFVTIPWNYKTYSAREISRNALINFVGPYFTQTGMLDLRKEICLKT